MPPRFISDDDLAGLDEGSSAPKFISDDELFAEEEPASLPSRLGSAALRGITETPGNLWELGKSAFGLATSPIETIQKAGPEKTARTVGTLAAGGSGALAGAGLGVPLAPFTFGLSVPVGAAFGGAAGILGFDKALQKTGADEPTTMEQDLEGMAYNTSQGLTMGAAGKLAGKTGGAFAGAADDLYKKATGMTFGEQKAGFKKGTFPVDEGGAYTGLDDASSVKSRLEQSLETATDDGFFKRIPEDSARAIELERLRSLKGASSEIDELAQAADDARANIGQGTRLIADFGKSQAYIDNLRQGNSRLAARLERRLQEVKGDWANSGQSFADLVKLKRGVGEGTNFSGKLTDIQQATGKLNRLIYDDLRTGLESHFDQLLPEQSGAFKAANQKYSAYSDLRKPGLNTLGRDQMGSLVKTMMNQFSSPGQALKTLGLGGAAFASPAIGGPLLAAKVLSDAYPVSMGNVSGAASSGFQAAGKGLQGLGPVLQAQGEEGEELMSPEAPTEEPEPAQTASAGLPDISPLVKAMISVESSGNRRAVSGKGAQGLMQIMPAMQRAYGVTDPFDPEQSIRGGTAIINDELKRFGDLRLALAAYNAGSPRVLRAIEKAGSEDFEAIREFLPVETRNYVDKVISRMA